MKKFFSVTACSFLSAAVLTGLSSCLKDKAFEEGKIQSVTSQSNAPKVIEIGLTGTDNTNFLTLALDASNNDTSVNLIPVNLASAEPAQEDINVTLVKNDALVADYNTNHGTSLQVASAAMYAILNANNVVTIPKGSYTGYLQIKLKPNSFIGGSYALGFSIGSVDKQGYTISGNFKSGIVALPIKNRYDGIYSVLSGTVTRYTAPGVPANDALSGSVTGNPDVTLSTVGANTVEVTNLKWAGGTSNVAGIDNLRLTVDPATNLVTVQALGNATLANWPGKTNKYDPAARTFTIAFRWNPTAAVREYETVIKYKKSR